MHRSRCVSSLVLLGASLLAACSVWTQQQEPPAQTISSHAGAPIRITRLDHSVLTLRDARVVGDSVIGTSDDDAALRSAVAVSDVESVETRQVDGARSVGLGLGVAVGVVAGVLAVALIAMASSNRGW